MAVMSTSRAPAAWAGGSERVALRRLVWVGPLAVAAALADEAARRLLLALVPGIPPASSRWRRARSR